MKFRTDKKAIPAKEIKSGVVGGHTYTLTSRYFLRDGKPCIYRMGEMHLKREIMFPRFLRRATTYSSPPPKAERSDRFTR